MLNVKLDIVHYVIRPSTTNSYTDVAASLWARFKCRSLAYRDWALCAAVTNAELGHSTEGEVFTAASRYLDQWDEDDDIQTADAAIRKKKKAQLKWIPTTIGINRQYAVGDRSGSVHLRLINNGDGYGQPHYSFLTGSGGGQLENEVLADGYCWLRAILMQLPQSLHFSKSWDPDTGVLLSQSKTAKKGQPLHAHTQKGSQSMAVLDREVKAVVAALAEFIILNPLHLKDAIQIAKFNTDVLGMEPLPPMHSEYEFMAARRLLTMAEDYLMPNHGRNSWPGVLEAQFRAIPKAVVMVTVCWTITYKGAETALKAYEAGNWSLHHKLGLVLKKGSTVPLTIKEYFTEILPDLVSPHEMPEL